MDRRWREPLAILAIITIALTAGLLYFAALSYWGSHGTSGTTAIISSTTVSSQTLNTFSSLAASTQASADLSIVIVKPDPNNMSAWVPIMSGQNAGQYAVKIKTNTETLFLFNLTNTGNTTLRILYYTYQFYYPNGTSGGFIGYANTPQGALAPSQSEPIWFSYGTNLPHFSYGDGKLVVTVYGVN